MLASLDVVKWQVRFKNSEYPNMHVSLDGTDFRIQEPKPFSKKWYSHKFRAAGIRDEIEMSIGNGDIVWASGGFHCGDCPDINIAKNHYLHYAYKEITLADRGYRYRPYFKKPSNSKERRVMTRHETVNSRLKQFRILECRYRHPLKNIQWYFMPA